MPSKAKDLRELTVAELGKKIRDSRQELLDLRMKKNTGQLDKPHLLRELRREIARMETIVASKKETAA